MTTHDVGGVPDYALMHRLSREALGTPELLAELREEIEEVYRLVTAELDRQRLEVERRDAEASRRFEQRVGRYGVALGIFSCVVGLLGVNRWEDASSATVAVAALLAAVLAVGGAVSVSRRGP
jgi:hypothetical protein